METSLTHCSCISGFWVLSCGSEQLQDRIRNTGLLSEVLCMDQHRFTEYYRSSVRSRKLKLTRRSCRRSQWSKVFML